MSSTNRGGERNESDFYPTPKWVTDALLARLPLHGKTILEPCAGDGAIIEALLAAGARGRPHDAGQVRSPKHWLHAVEIQGGLVHGLSKLCSATEADFLKWGTTERFDLVIMNPPFSLAQEFVEHAVKFLAPGGTCAVLGRLAFFLSGQGRAKFRREYPFDFLALGRRPSFSGEWVRRLEASGADVQVALEPLRRPLPKEKRMETVAEVRARLMGSDSADYCWALVGPGCGGHFEILEAA